MSDKDLTYYLVPDSNSPEIQLFPGKEYLIGRSPLCTILLSDGAVSREHARLVFSGNSFELKDLDSTNGTKVNDSPVSTAILNSLDRLTCGRISFTYKIRKKTAQGHKTLTPGDTALLETELDKIIEDMDRSDLKSRLKSFREQFDKAKKDLLDLAYGDDLTGLYNRRYFDKTVDTEFRRALRYGRPLTLIMVDIDHFKKFNDTYGHQKGDSVLRTVGTILRENCRSSDMVCRYGGEEMVVILPEQDLNHGLDIAEKLRRLLEIQAVEIENVKITASFGVSTSLKEDRSSDSLIRRSDKALYKAKQSGRNCTRCQT